MAAWKFVRLQVSCDIPSSKHNFTGQSTSVCVRLCETEVAGSPSLAARVTYENISFMQSSAFPVPLFCTLQIPFHPGNSSLVFVFGVFICFFADLI